MGKASISKKGRSIILLLGSLVVVYIIFKLLEPSRFGSPASLFILFQQSLIYSITGCGCYFIITMGLFDFSVGSIIIMSALIGCKLSGIMGYPGLIIGCVAVGTAMGLLNGFFYRKFRIPSIIVTVGLAIIYECISYILSGSGINRLGSNVKLLGRAPYNIILACVSFAIAFYIIEKTKLGIYIRAIGRNEAMAKNIGIDVDKIKFYGFILCGLFAGISAIITLSRNASIIPVTGMESMNRNFQPFMGCFVGVAFKKYISPVISIIASEFLIAMIVSGVITIGLDSTLQNFIIGGILLIVVAITANEQRSSGEVVK